MALVVLFVPFGLRCLRIGKVVMDAQRIRIWGVSELNAAIGSGTIVTLCFDINQRLANVKGRARHLLE